MTRRAVWCWLLLLGCKGAEVRPDAPPPTFPTQELTVVQSLTEFKLKFSASVQSTEAMTVQKAVYELVVDGKVIKKAQEPLNLQVPAGQATPFSFEQTTQYVSSADELKEMDTRGGSLLAAIRGTLEVLSATGKPLSVEFARSREVRVPRLPHMKFQELEAGRYAEDEAGVTFHVGVYNPNPFEITLSSIKYAVTMGGKPVAESVIGKGERVSPSSTGVFDIEAKISQDTHGADIKKLIKSKVLPYVITGELTADLFHEPFEFKGDIKLNTSSK